jgi:hypothetical protein
MLHDLKSIWWIAVWFSFYTHPQDQKPVHGQAESAKSLFSRESDVSERQLTLRNQTRWAHHIQHIPTQYIPMADNLNNLQVAYVNMAELTFVKELRDRNATVALVIQTGHDKTAYQIFQECLVNTMNIPITFFRAVTTMTVPVVSQKQPAKVLEGVVDGQPGGHDEGGSVKRRRSLRLQKRRVGTAH